MFFKLDPFQEEAVRLVREGRSVLVCAPTGTGKTVVADAVVERALAEGRDVIYTAPVKALSNQKFRDYCRRHGESKVGLVTGDLVIRHDAPCRVMTTEILRNMLLMGEPLPELAAVILDEIHFLADRERGTVWEEVLIYLPHTVQVLGLSATLANVQEFADWLGSVRGTEVAVVEHHKRAVPLETLWWNTHSGLCPPEEFAKRQQKWRAHSERKSSSVKHHFRQRSEERTTSSHLDLVPELVDLELSPLIWFVFARRLAEQNARALGRKIRRTLLDAERFQELHERLDRAEQEIGAGVLDGELRRLYEKGVAFHHAGLHVHLKALVEELYERKLIEVLYTTSTFALGVNMPARTVVLDGVEKFDGRDTVPMSVREYMQHAGRAGRRGMDSRGTVVLRLEFEDYPRYEGMLRRYLAGHPERVDSAFNLSFNSVLNLLARHGRTKARELVERSFSAWRQAQETEVLEKRADNLETHGGRKEQKEAAKLRRRLEEVKARAWNDFERRRLYLVQVGYLGEDDELQNGAKILRYMQIEEIFATELVLSGLLEEIDTRTLFGVLTGMSGSLPRGLMLRYKPTQELRKVVRKVNEVRNSPIVRGAEAITGTPVNWEPELVIFGQRWASGAPLAELQGLYVNSTDISGQLVGSFRRAKDLVSQLMDAHQADTHMVEALRDLLRRVSRDEVEVVD